MRVTTKYQHRRGIHCESACQRNLLAASGLEVSEEVIFGLDGSFGFSIFPSQGNVPDVVVGKQEILPLRAAKLMGIEVQPVAPKSSRALARLLDRHTAVLVRVDLGRLPQWGMQGRSSFGGYFVNAVEALDETIEISDPAFEESMNISFEDLDAARTSKAAAPLNPGCKAYLFGEVLTEPRLDLVGPVAVRNTCRDLLRPDTRNQGARGLKRLQAAARAWPEQKVGEVEDVDLSGHVTPTSALARQLVHLGRQIELFGTGGGLFRPLFSRYLSALADATGTKMYAEAAELFAASGEAWSGLGQTLLRLDFAARPSDLEPLVTEVIDAVGRCARHESQALASLAMLA